MTGAYRRLILVVILVALALGSARASGPVFLPVIVKDGKGQSITGLAPSAFSVRDAAGTLAPATVVADGPASVVVLVDASMSMDARALTQARMALRRIVKGLEPGSEYAVLAIVAGAISPGWGGPDGIDRTLDELEARRARGAAGPTPLFDAMLQGLRLVETGRFARRVVLLVTDGADTLSTTPRSEVNRQVQNTSALLTAIVPRLRVEGRVAQDLSEYIPAELTGGRALSVSSDRDWETAANEILADIRHYYVVGVTPPSEGSGTSRARWREVKVSVDVPPGLRNGSVRVRHRKGYFGNQ
jgi:VWFA-related protein